MSKPKVTLKPMDLHSPTESSELLHQRILCGWDKTPEVIETWKGQMDAGTLSMFWIIPESNGEAAEQGTGTGVGHIAMTLKPDTLHEGKTVQHICNLFILPERRGGGFASLAVRALESEALKQNCHAITLNALSRRYIEDEEERVWYAKLCASLGIEMPERGRSNEDWYSRMGFLKEREERLYPVVLEGESVLLWAAWMRKEI